MGTYLRGLVAAMIRERGEDELILFHGSPRRGASLPPAVEDLAGSAGATRALLRRPRRAATLWDQVAWPGTLARWRLDVFHSPFWTLPVMAGSGLALVQTIHDLTPLKIPGSVSLKNRLIFRANFACARRARRIIVPSRATAEDVTRMVGIPAARIRSIPEAAAVEPALLEGAPGILEGLRARHGLHGRYLLHTGGCDPVKDLPTAVAAAGMAAGSRDLRLVITGEAGPAAGDLLRLAGEAGLGGRLVLTGFVGRGELVALYHGAAAVIYPSLNEGFGLPVLEAMACGTPVVASSAGALPEVGGDACLYAPPGDPEAFAGELGRILDDDALARRLRDAGRRRAAGFTWEAAARSTLDVYREAVA